MGWVFGVSAHITTHSVLGGNLLSDLVVVACVLPVVLPLLMLMLLQFLVAQWRLVHCVQLCLLVAA